MRIVRLTASVILALLFLVPISWMLVVSIKDEGMKITGVLDWYKPRTLLKPTAIFSMKRR
ncbi:hypothetical protein [Paenibacillus hexagrammi]|uniref:Carbohydrate ABC transporter permease n=1 Tax=Paenibacillus hexagrammi TaxID=2908839 RepID=A0ABY3SLX3_9BACL|nr:hypothetical protein [Paenibacillus sp. YPD9-1]UJF34878.1 hypothetical protein L0M14_06925 [Paenibacillus sp. YPD9-1]